MAYQSKDFEQDEQDIFDTEWNAFITKHYRTRESVDVFEDHRDGILEAAKIAKYQLESEFGGQNAQTNQFGWGPILPNHILATGTPTYATATWRQYIETSDVTARWKDWIGSSASNLKLSKYATMVIIGFADNVEDPKIDGILAKAKGQEYPIWAFGEAMKGTDNNIYQLTTPLVIEAEQEIYLQQLCGRAGLSELHPIGVYFAKGDHMRDKAAYAKV